MHPICLANRAFGAVQVRALRMEDLLNVKTFLRISLCSFVSVVFNFRQNKSPFAIALGDWFGSEPNYQPEKLRPTIRGSSLSLLLLLAK